MIHSLASVSLFADAVGALPDWQDSDVIAAMLILVLGMALGIGLTCLLLVIHFLRKGRLAERPVRRPAEGFSLERRFSLAVLPVPSRWLAIRSGNLQLVQSALGLSNPAPCSWEEGLSVAHEKKLFITPPIGGWILVIGSSLPEPSEDVDKSYRFIMELSRKLGQVQFFSVNRVLNQHAWVQVSEGRVVRAYAWAGRTLWNQGRLTKAEADLGLTCFPYAEAMIRTDFGRMDPAAVNTERVPLLASRWSVDPTSIDARMLKETHGIAGQLTRSRTH